MKTYFTLFLALAFTMPSISMSEEKRSKTINTPDGSFTTTITSVEPTPQIITAVNANVVKLFNSHASKGNKFVADYLPKVKKPSLKDFDEAFRMWQVERNPRYTEQQVTEILGAYLGNKLISDFQMEWVIVKDEYGADYAVRTKRYEVLSFPFSSVVKRIEKNQYDFMVGVYYTIKSSIESGEYDSR